jgi:hypothetical protein
MKEKILMTLIVKWTTKVHRRLLDSNLFSKVETRARLKRWTMKTSEMEEEQEEEEEEEDICRRDGSADRNSIRPQAKNITTSPYLIGTSDVAPNRSSSDRNGLRRLDSSGNTCRVPQSGPSACTQSICCCIPTRSPLFASPLPSPPSPPPPLLFWHDSSAAPACLITFMICAPPNPFDCVSS